MRTIGLLERGAAGRKTTVEVVPSPHGRGKSLDGALAYTPRQRFQSKVGASFAKVPGIALFEGIRALFEGIRRPAAQATVFCSQVETADIRISAEKQTDRASD